MSTRFRNTFAAFAAAAFTLGVVFVSAAESSAGATSVARLSNGSGYWLAGADGGVFAFGTAHFYGSMAGKHLAAPISGIVPTADEHGYWLVAKNGAVFPFGDALAKGSMAGKAIAAPIVGIAASDATGSAGATGAARGATGPRGPAGVPGTGPTTSWAYVFNTTPETVAIEAAIPFDTNGPLLGFTHTAGSANITATENGLYRVNFSVSATEPNQFALFVNGAPSLGTVVGSGAGTQQNNGQPLVLLAPGDVITVRNHTSPSTVTLATVIGGTQTNVNASITVERIGPPAG